MGLYDYPETDKHPAFNLQMRVNFVDGSERGEGLRLIGTDGYIDMGWDAVKVVHHKISNDPGYGGWDSFETFTTSQQKDYEKWYKAKYPKVATKISASDIEFKAPQGYSANLDHHVNFYKGIREKAVIKEDAIFSMRAAGPALATNKSYFDKAIVNWDPEAAKVI
jgi:hypothetical protein